MSEQTKLSQAQNSVDTLQHAVDQAESHPSENKIEEASQSMRHARAAVEQAVQSGSGDTEGLVSQLEEEKAALRGSYSEE